MTSGIYFPRTEKKKELNVERQNGFVDVSSKRKVWAELLKRGF